MQCLQCHGLNLQTAKVWVSILRLPGNGCCVNVNMLSTCKMRIHFKYLSEIWRWSFELRQRWGVNDGSMSLIGLDLDFMVTPDRWEPMFSPLCWFEIESSHMVDCCLQFLECKWQEITPPRSVGSHGDTLCFVHVDRIKGEVYFTLWTQSNKMAPRGASLLFSDKWQALFARIYLNNSFWNLQFIYIN